MASQSRTMKTRSLAMLLLVLTAARAQPDMSTVYVGPQLSHLVLDNDTGMLYAAGINRLYQLDSDLGLVSEAVTGPKEDSIDCLPPPHDECSTGRRSTDNHNKILLLDRAQQMLITCGSVYQGACETRSLSNISHLEMYYGADDVTDFAVAANSRNASTVAFIAPGPSTHSHDVMYVAATYTGRSRTSRIYRDQVPAVSSRSLRSRGRFSLAAVSNPLRGMSSSIYLKSEISSYFLIRYVTGFSYRGFSYFLTVQNDSVEDRADNRRVSKIVQICQDDSNFFSYADIPVTCTKDGVDYNVLEAAQIISPGLRLRESLGFVDGFTDEVLVATFSRRDERWESVDSAVCMYTMQDVRATFLENIKLCHQGNSSVSGGGYLRVGPRGNCNHPIDYFPKGTEQFDLHPFPKGTEQFDLHPFPKGTEQFDLHPFPKGTEQFDLHPFPKGTEQFDLHPFPKGTEQFDLHPFPKGTEQFDLHPFPKGTEQFDLHPFPKGTEQFNLHPFPKGTEQFDLHPFPKGTEQFDLHPFPKGTEQFDLHPFPKGTEQFDLHPFPKGTEQFDLHPFPKGTEQFDLHPFPKGTEHFDLHPFPKGTEQFDLHPFPKGTEQFDLHPFPKGTEHFDLHPFPPRQGKLAASLTSTSRRPMFAISTLTKSHWTIPILDQEKGKTFPDLKTAG
ncbi:hypothetical protein ACOMHN_038636 [Nucella lapillus]